MRGAPGQLPAEAGGAGQGGEEEEEEEEQEEDSLECLDEEFCELEAWVLGVVVSAERQRDVLALCFPLFVSICCRVLSASSASATDPALIESGRGGGEEGGVGREEEEEDEQDEQEDWREFFAAHRALFADARFERELRQLALLKDVGDRWVCMDNQRDSVDGRDDDGDGEDDGLERQVEDGEAEEDHAVQMVVEGQGGDEDKDDNDDEDEDEDAEEEKEEKEGPVESGNGAPPASAMANGLSRSAAGASAFAEDIPFLDFVMQGTFHVHVAERESLDMLRRFMHDRYLLLLREILDTRVVVHVEREGAPQVSIPSRVVELQMVGKDGRVHSFEEDPGLVIASEEPIVWVVPRPPRLRRREYQTRRHPRREQGDGPKYSARFLAHTKQVHDNLVLVHTPPPPQTHPADADTVSTMFLTALNVGDQLVCADMNPSANFVLGGFRDSTMRLWVYSSRSPGPGTGRAAAATAAAAVAANTAADSDATDQPNRPAMWGDIRGEPAATDASGSSSSSSSSLLPSSSSSSFAAGGGAAAAAVAGAGADIVAAENTVTTVELVGHHRSVQAVCLYPDGKKFLSGSMDGTVRLWDLQTLSQIAVYDVASPVWSLDWFRLGAGYFATGLGDRSVRVFMPSQKTVSRIFYGHVTDVSAVQVHPNGAYVASGSYDGGVRLWDVGTAQSMCAFADTTSPITTLRFSPQGRYLAAGCANGDIRLWDLDTREMCGAFVGHSALVNSLVFSGSESALFSGSMDCTVQTWDLSFLEHDLGQRIASVAAHAAGSGHVHEGGKARWVDHTYAEVFPTRIFATKQSPVFAMTLSGNNCLTALGAYSLAPTSNDQSGAGAGPS